jgi:hypothetical protein
MQSSSTRHEHQQSAFSRGSTKFGFGHIADSRLSRAAGGNRCVAAIANNLRSATGPSGSVIIVGAV